MDRAPRRRTPGHITLAVVFALLALNTWAEVVSILRGRSGGPTALTILQVLVGATCTVTAWGAWIGARWAPVAATVYGLVTAAMLVALGPLLDLGPDASRGLWLGAAVMLMFALASAWYLRRDAKRSTVT